MCDPLLNRNGESRNVYLSYHSNHHGVAKIRALPSAPDPKAGVAF